MLLTDVYLQTGLVFVLLTTQLTSKIIYNIKYIYLQLLEIYLTGSPSMCLLAMCLFRSLLHFELFPHSVQANTPFSISFTMESSSSLLTEVSINPEMEVKIYITGTWWYSLFYFTILFIFIFLLLS